MTIMAPHLYFYIFRLLISYPENSFIYFHQLIQFIIYMQDMQEQRFAAARSLIDPFTDTRYALADGEVEITEKGKSSKIFPLANAGTDIRKKSNRFYLKFTKKSSTYVTISPHGTLVTSKSDRIQQVDLNISLDRGQIWWELFVPHTTLFLTVGVKDAKQTVFSTFDFCLKHSAKLQFKLNVDNLSFKTWTNGLPTEAKSAINLEKGLEWTPFVRIREIGTTLSINSLIPDPQNISSEFNPFTTLSNYALGGDEFKVEEKELNFERQRRFTNIFLANRNSLIISGQNELKLVKRSQSNNQFNFEQLIQKIVEGNAEIYLIKITQQELNLLAKAEEIWGVKLLGNVIRSGQNLWIGKREQEWSSWINAVCIELDRRLAAPSNSKNQLAILIYRWILQKVQALRNVLTANLKISAWNAFDSELVNSIDRNSFNSRETEKYFIQPSVYVNNVPYYSFSQPILSINSTENYVYLKFASNKITIFSIRNSLFKIGDFIISKAIKKENELTQYKKQADEIKDNDFSKPSIYKILKNCLKYADKVKPPEKLIKELEQKKALIKEKQKAQQKKVSSQFVPDKELQNTLVQMGFDISIAKKALTQCKNSSLEAAMDLILSKTLKVQAAKILLPKKQWTCQACTLVNAENVAICIACEAPAPLLDEIEQKKEEAVAPPVIEEEIKSEKIEEQLKQVYSFQTDIGFLPLIVGGVFKTQIRFRLFCLNPRFFATFYQKGDAYANLIDNTFNSSIHQITTAQIQSLSNTYYDQNELKQKNFGWIPIEDYNQSMNEEVSAIRYERIGFEKEQFIFRALIHYASKTKSLTFKINTSAVYLEKQKSFILVKEQWVQAEVAAPTVETTITLVENKKFQNCRELEVKSNNSIEFQAFFSYAGECSQLPVKEVQCIPNDSNRSGGFLNLSVIKCPQQVTYPNVLFISPWKQSYISEGPFKNSLVLGHSQKLKINVEAISLQLPNKDDKISGFIYFSNDYNKKPLSKYSFRFEGNTKKLNLPFDNISALFVVIVLQPHLDDRLVELTNISVYGSVSESSSISTEIRYEINPEQLNVKLVGVKEGTETEIKDYQLEAWIANSNLDLDKNIIKGNQSNIHPNLQVKIHVTPQSSSSFTTIKVSSLSISNFNLLSVNSYLSKCTQTQTSEELKAEFNKLLDEYLATSDKNLLQSLISQNYSNFKGQIKGKSLKDFILNHVCQTPFDSNKKFYFQIFINNFETQLKAHSKQLDITNILLLGLQSKDLTAFGLQLLLLFNKITNSLSISQLMEVSISSLRQIREWKNIHQRHYLPYEQKTIFSPYIHQLLSQQKSPSTSRRSIDKIHQSIILKKYKFTRRYLIDFFSVHHLRSLDLYFEQSQTKNKLILTFKWIDESGKQVGNINEFIDYTQWIQLTSRNDIKNSSNEEGILTIDLKRHNIQTRYLIIECHFTLRSLTGSKIEIQNLIDKDIVPVAYGNYVKQQNPIPAFPLEGLKDAKFICKTQDFNKYSLQGSADTFYFEEDEVKAEVGDVSLISNKLQLRENKQKWIKLQMNDPKNGNTDFYFTLLCSITEAISRTQISENEKILPEWISLMIDYVAQDQSLPIQQLSVKAIRHIIESRADLHNIVLNCEFKNSHTISGIFKNNPLLRAEERAAISKQLVSRESGHKYLAQNCLNLLKGLEHQSQIETVRDLGVALLRLFNSNGQEEQICELSNILGWIQGADEVFEKASRSSTKRTLAKATKTSTHLLNYLKKGSQAGNPTESFWIIVEQIIGKGFDLVEFNEIFESFLDWIVQTNKEEDSDSQTFIQFERFIKTTSKVTFDQSIAEKIITVYFNLDNRIILLNQFLKSSFLSLPWIKEILIKHAIKEISSFTHTKASKSVSKDQLTFLIDILSFIYNEQKPQFSHSQSIKSDLYNITADFIQRFINFGGVQGCRNLKEIQISKISLCHYLTLQFSKEDQINDDEYSKFSNWYILNLSQVTANETSSAAKFRAIHENVWKVLLSGFNSQEKYAQIIGKMVVDILKETRTIKNNRFLSVLYQAKVYAFLKRILKHFEQQSQKKPFLNYLLRKSSIFRKILEEIQEINVFQTTQNPIISEKQLANNLNLLNEQKPKDWTLYLQGAPQSVFTVDFTKQSKHFSPLTFQSNNLFWLSELVIGFHFNAQTLAPKEISLQIGQTLETLKSVGNLQLIPLESYLTHSVKVFSINLHRPTSRKWHNLRTTACRFARLTIKSPYSQLFEVIDTTSSTFKEVSKISFISLKGYEQNGASAGPNDVHDIVESLQILSSSKNKDLFGHLLNEEENIQHFQKSLLNISYLMGNESYGLQLHRFLMRVCELNVSLGNTMLKEYLQLKNPFLFSKIAAEIAGSNFVEAGRRASNYFQFILKELQSEKQPQLLPFINKFTQLVSTLQKMVLISPLVSEVSIDVPEKLIKLIIERAESDTSYRKLAKLILSHQKPLIFVGYNFEAIYEELYHSTSSSSSELLASLITSQPRCSTWFIEKKYLGQIFSTMLHQIKENKDSQSIANRLSFLTILCQNIELKELITKSQYDLKIFEILVGRDGEKLLSQSSNKQLRLRLVDFIAKASLSTENQRIIGALLKDSLSSMILESSQQFVAEIFLPLLNSFSKTPVCLLPYNKTESKLLTDLSVLKIQGDSSKNEDKAVQAFKLASQIISETENASFFSKLKQCSHHKWGSFNLVANHGKLPTFKNIELIKKQILKGQKSALIIFQSKARVGVFFNHSKQNLSQKNSIGWNRGSFIFSIDEKGTFTVNSYVNPKENLLVLSQSQQTETDSLKVRFKNKTIAEVFFDGITSSVVTLCSPKGQSQEKFPLESAEYWIFDFESVSSYDAVYANQESFAKKLLAQLSDYSFFKSELKADHSLQLLREEPLYEFPSSITLKQLKQSIEIYGYTFSEENIDKVKLKVLKDREIKQNDTLEALSKRSSSNDFILDLLLQTDSLPPIQPKNELNKIEFLPRKGILKFFEENDGVKAMIKVIKKSIGQWKNVSRKQKWEQYAVQLENFSAFPHFFSAYLKDKDTFKLLLDLLSGLPDKETDAKWDELEVAASQKLLKIVSDILSMDRGNEFRSYALKHDFMSTILERLRLLSGVFKRRYEEEVVEESNNNSPSKKQTGEDDGTKKIKKKKGVGYGNDTNSNTKWMKGQNLANLKKDFQNIETILALVQSFLNSKDWDIPQSFLNQLLESSLLPYIEDCLRAGTLLEISKHPQKFKAVLKLIRALAKQQKLVVCLMPLSSNYQPNQTESVQSLLKNLFNISKIFISCLNQNLTKEDKISQEFANDIIETYNLVEEAIEERANIGQNQNEITNILALPLDKKYRELLKDLRFDYIDMKESPNKIKHHYSSNFTANYTPNHNKMIRLAQELADISTALPHEHTNAVFVRCDKDRVDFMQALIMGSNGTPYGHGAFLFDIYFDDNYPNGPPKVNLTTTGHGKIRFNPNLYSCGKVCLSLLGTWRGSASENWDAKVSTLLQVLLSIQAIIMSEEVYFNEPGFENEQGTEQGEKKNEAYSNIVRYGNIKFAMIQNIRNPPKGFQAVIRRHFYLKKDEILEECRRWLKYAEKRPANYVGLVNDHNVSWSTEFKKSKTQYKEMLEKAIKELQEELHKLAPPKITDITPKHIAKKERKRKDESKNVLNALQGAKLEQIDVSYEKIEGKQLDINDQKVKDRWSRYIGAMGIDAVSKQSKADILILGLGPFGLEVIKNIVLSGCRRLTLCDDQEVKLEDLSGGFFYQEDDIGKKRVQTIIHKIRELNSYVKIDTISRSKLQLQLIAGYSLVFVSELPLPEQKAIAIMCREKKVKFISADCRSAYCRLVNDFGEFTVLDKNGEEPVEVMLSNIEISERGLVTLLEGAKHPFEDGEAIIINHVQGMHHIENKDKSINGTIHTIKVVNYKSFEIGNTLHYDKYIRNGTAKNIKTPVVLKYRPFEASVDPEEKELGFDANLQFFDFSKLSNEKLVQRCYIVLDHFRIKNKRLPLPWSLKDAEIFLSTYTSLWNDELSNKEKRFIEEFSFTCKGYLPPLCAFFGGLAAQQIIKAITQKYKPINSAVYLEFSEIIPQKEGEGAWIQKQLDDLYTPTKSRDEGFSIVVGRELAEWIKNAKLFMIGAGAIGCQLLKNLAMVGLGTGKDGKIVLTDPDHIQNSNLNRQFLFREKHISKPKSSTAAASVLLMNPLLKGHISALLERVSDSTKEIFSNKFFESLTVVANALDNVAARRYVDQRCVENKIPLFESGTLGPKGHVQVIIPYKTESYGSQNDPVQEGEIPHCTLKMFPEETLHCVEWARDIFGKKFTLQPKALAKFLEKGYKPQSDDIKSLNESLTMVAKGPKNFEDCINYAIHKFYKYFRDDVMQLLYTYPLDAKTKNGEPFWRLPKRPPTPIKCFNPEDLLHCTFVTSLAVLLAKIYQLPFPQSFRTQKERFAIGKAASQIKIPEFVPSDQKAKAILKETTSEEKKEKKQNEESQITQIEQPVINSKNEEQLHKELLTEANGEFSIRHEEFQKDEDGNGHIDFIYSMANLRAINYKLDPMDWITTKLKAGRIVPALATTTSCVAGLQTLEICKYLKKIKIDNMRNAYLNLAVPSLQMSEPGEVKKTKITDKLTVTLWDRWEIECNDQVTFGDVYKILHEKYGLFAKGVLQGMSRIDHGKTENDQKAFLSLPVLDKLEKEQNYVDIVVLFTISENDDKILEGIPTVRLIFKK